MPSINELILHNDKKYSYMLILKSKIMYKDMLILNNKTCRDTLIVHDD